MCNIQIGMVTKIISILLCDSPSVIVTNIIALISYVSVRYRDVVLQSSATCPDRRR